MIVDPGKLRHRVVLQEYTLEQDAQGNELRAWKDAAVLWCAVNGLYGQEYWAAAANGQQDTMVFVTRWSRRLDRLVQAQAITGCRLLYGGRVYRPTSYDDLEHRHELVKLKAVME